MSKEGSLRRSDRIGLSAYYFFVFAALGFVAAFLPLFLRARGLTLTQIGALGAIQALAGAGTQVPIGMLSDRIGRRKPLVTGGALILGAIFLLFDKVQSFTGFCLLYFATGSLYFGIATLTNALISDWTAVAGSTGRNFGNTRIWGSLGFIASLAAVSAMPGISEGGNLLPAIALLYWIGGLSIIPVSESEKHTHDPQPVFKCVPELIRNANLVIFLLTFFIYRICENSGMSFLSLYLQDLKATRSLIALAWAFSAAVEMPFMVWVGGASDRMGRRPPLVIAFLMMPLRLFLYAQIRNPMDVFYVQMFHGVTFSFMLVGSLAFVADLSPGRLRATGQGLLNMVGALSMVFGPLLGGWLADRTSIHAMYAMLALGALVGGTMFVLLVHESHPGLDDDPSVKWHCPRFLIPAARLLYRPVLGIRNKGNE